MHPNQGKDRAIEDAINAIRTTNTRKPPDKISSSEESDQHADNESSSCHGGSSEMDADSFDENGLRLIQRITLCQSKTGTQSRPDGVYPLQLTGLRR